jgi:hypothetical protein
VFPRLRAASDPNDWAFQRFEDEKKGVVRDYTTVNPAQLALTSVWAGIVFAGIGRSIVSLSSGIPFWSFLPWVD